MEVTCFRRVVGPYQEMGKRLWPVFKKSVVELMAVALPLISGMHRELTEEINRDLVVQDCYFRESLPYHFPDIRRVVLWAAECVADHSFAKPCGYQAEISARSIKLNQPTPELLWAVPRIVLLIAMARKIRALDRLAEAQCLLWAVVINVDIGFVHEATLILSSREFGGNGERRVKALAVLLRCGMAPLSRWYSPEYLVPQVGNRPYAVHCGKPGDYFLRMADTR